MTAPIWIAVDELTMPTKRRVEHDDGTTSWHEVPSLWDQSGSALETGMGCSGNPSTLSERSPLDVTLMEIRGTIADTTRHELNQRRLGRRDHDRVPAMIRTLAAYIVGHQPDQLWWFEYRFASWARVLGTYLQAYERQPNAVHLRNTPCPTCGCRQVIDDDGMVHPAIVIDFRDDLVRAAQCRHCGALWWRGPQLEQLAALLHNEAA